MTETNNSSKQCRACGKTDVELMRCAQCKLTFYCGQDCQKKHWPEHKQLCKETAKAKQGEQPNAKKTNTNEEGLDAFGKLKHIGSGNFSEIFKTTSKKDGKVYAIKQV